MKIKDIRDLTDEELAKQLEEAKEELFNLRFQLATGQLDNGLKIRDARRQIARVQTIRRERELAAAKVEG
ncbi:MAG: 50S ribosomal protein L29 [Actinomycetota bacterium]|nr:50S ribosomal protein L29 [Actinomycetota bacterium]